MRVIAFGGTFSLTFPFLPKCKPCWNTLQLLTNLLTMGRFFVGGSAPESRSQSIVAINVAWQVLCTAGGRKGDVIAKLFPVLQACRNEP